MQYPLEYRLPYWLLTLIALAVFYGIYFAKMLAQKRRGIRTNQIGRRKERTLHAVETAMSVATLGVVAAQLVSVIFGWSWMPANARFTGFCIALFGRSDLSDLRYLHAGQLARRNSGAG